MEKFIAGIVVLSLTLSSYPMFKRLSLIIKKQKNEENDNTNNNEEINNKKLKKNNSSIIRRNEHYNLNKNTKLDEGKTEELEKKTKENELEKEKKILEDKKLKFASVFNLKFYKNNNHVYTYQNEDDLPNNIIFTKNINNEITIKISPKTGNQPYSYTLRDDKVLYKENSFSEYTPIDGNSEKHKENYLEITNHLKKFNELFIE